MPSLIKDIEIKLKAIEKDSSERNLTNVNCSIDNPNHILCEKKTMISFSGNDYLGLSKHPNVIKAAKKALLDHGTGAGASRYITGNNSLYTHLENILAEIKNKDACLVFGSGYLANIGVIPALVEKKDLIIADKLIHASMIDAAKLSGAKLIRFRHNDPEHCKELLEKNRKQYRQCLVITEHVFSMDGDIAPTKELQNIAHQYDSLLLTDDAHGLGTRPNLSKHDTDICIGTLSKAVGSYGGYVCASQMIIAYIQQKARSLIYTTGLPPATIAASISALKIIKDTPELTESLLQKARYFCSALSLRPAHSAIVPYIIGSNTKTLQVAEELKQNGFYVSAIRPPTVPDGKARLRFTFSATHEEKEIDLLIKKIKSLKL